MIEVGGEEDEQVSDIKITNKDRASIRKWAKYIGGIRSEKKAQAARQNGQLGGRPQAGAAKHSARAKA